MTHTDYVIACYGITALVVGIMIGWILFDAKARKRELQQLEAAGIRRRSAGNPA